MQTNELPREVRVRLDLPESLIEKYEKQADDRRMALEGVLLERLERTVDQNVTRHIQFTDSERQELDELLGVNVTTGKQVVDRVRRALSVKITSDGKPLYISIKPALLSRLRSRCFLPNFEKFVKERIVEGLETFVGLR